MNPRHKKQALAGVALWFALPVGFAAFLAIYGHLHKANQPPVDSGIHLLVFWIWLATQSVCFFWCGYHLTKAKGYPRSVLLPGLLGPCLQLLMLILLLVLTDKRPEPTDYTAKKRSSRRHESHVERIVRYRRNALLGNVFGLLGIIAGVKLVLFPMGFFQDLENETAVGIFVFLFGYAGVITGCWWWAKAKDWPDVIVFIGLSPLVILFIPYVRLIFVALPGLLAAGMVMMPLIMLVVMMVLPDKSGLPESARRKRRFDRNL